MKKIVGIQFRDYGKLHYFNSGHFVLKKGDRVVVETEKGQELGSVCSEPKNSVENLPDKPLRKVFRLATTKDIERFDKRSQQEKEIYAFCYETMKERSLPMCLVSVERLIDGSKIMIYFTADGRVDFRELVKDLVQKYHTRIEMKQIGVRYEAKMVGALGACGRQLCCSSFLTNFEPVSIRMAKEQNLSLNPSKISGMCGRLMCCLTYEYGYYQKAKKDIPKIGKKVETIHGEGKVIRQNLLRKTLTVMLDSGEEIEASFDDIVNNASPDKRRRKE